MSALLAFTACSPAPALHATTTTTTTTASTTTAGTAPQYAGMPPTANTDNVYSQAGANMFSPAVAGAKAYVYVPSAQQGGAGTVDVIDQATMAVVSSFTAGAISQHVVPSWDLKTLYVTASAANQLVPIDPTTGRPGTPIPVRRPYNLYFSPDGSRAIVQAEQNNRIDYYDTHTWTRLKSVPSTCKGNNHADWSADGSYFIVTCEFSGDLLKVDTTTGDIITKIRLPGAAMPQDVRLTPNGTEFYVADMMSDGLWILDGATMHVTGRIDTGVGDTRHLPEPRRAPHVRVQPRPPHGRRVTPLETRRRLRLRRRSVDRTPWSRRGRSRAVARRTWAA